MSKTKYTNIGSGSITVNKAKTENKGNNFYKGASTNGRIIFGKVQFGYYLAGCLATASLCFAAYVLTSTNVSNGIFMNNSSMGNISLSNGSSLVSTSSVPFPLFLLAISALSFVCGMSYFIERLYSDNSQAAAENKPSAQSESFFDNKSFGLLSILSTIGLGYFAGSGYAKSHNIMPLAVGAIACGLIGAGLNGLFTGKYNFFIGNSIAPTINCGNASTIVNIYLWCDSVQSTITTVCNRVAEVSLWCNSVNVNNLSSI
ncbi:MAG: hypothetical protein K0R73_139 [Candidatus Midichloriaceae bacterium]|jgi:hypothetical protein|nr:hypothetical protein [Candidatus Midichloriaceae bacterium]